MDKINTSNKYNFYQILMVSLIIILNNKYMYLISLKNRMYINIIIFVIFILFITIFNKNYKYKFIHEIFIFYLIVIYTSLLSKTLLNQSFRQILDANREMIYYVLYFPLCIIMNKEDNKNMIKKIIKILGLLFTIMIIIQYFLYPNIKFMSGVGFAYRLDGYRFFGGFPLVITSFFLFVEEFFCSKKLKAKFTVIIILMIQYYYIIFITKTRNIFVAVSIAFIVLLIIQKKYRGYKKLLIMIITGLIVTVFFKDYLIQLIELSLNDTTGTGQDRIEYINYVLDNISKSFYLGYGLTSPQFEKVTYHIHDDIGIFGFLFEFGIFGIIILISIIFKFILMTLKIYRINPNKSYYFIIYIVYTIIIMPFNCVLNVGELIIFFIISLTLLENEYKKLDKK